MATDVKKLSNALVQDLCPPHTFLSCICSGGGWSGWNQYEGVFRTREKIKRFVAIWLACFDDLQSLGLSIEEDHWPVAIVHSCNRPKNDSLYFILVRVAVDLETTHGTPGVRWESILSGMLVSHSALTHSVTLFVQFRVNEQTGI